MPLPELNQIGSWLGEGTIPLSLIHAPAPKRVGHILYPGLTTAEEGGGGGGMAPEGLGPSVHSAQCDMRPSCLTLENLCCMLGGKERSWSYAKGRTVPVCSSMMPAANFRTLLSR